MCNSNRSTDPRRGKRLHGCHSNSYSCSVWIIDEVEGLCSSYCSRCCWSSIPDITCRCSTRYNCKRKSEARLRKQCWFSAETSGDCTWQGITSWSPDWIGEADSVITKCYRSCHLSPVDYEEHAVITSPSVPVAKGIS